MDRLSKSSANHTDIICGTSFEQNDVLQELSRLRHASVEIIRSKQEDAHELLCQLLSEIHDEMIRSIFLYLMKFGVQSLIRIIISIVHVILRVNQICVIQ
jgi:hypothetical protein